MSQQENIATFSDTCHVTMNFWPKIFAAELGHGWDMKKIKEANSWKKTKSGDLVCSNKLDDSSAELGHGWDMKVMGSISGIESNNSILSTVYGVIKRRHV